MTRFLIGLAKLHCFADVYTVKFKTAVNINYACRFYVNMQSWHISHIFHKCAYRIFCCINCHFQRLQYSLIVFIFFVPFDCFNSYLRPNVACFHCIFHLVMVRVFRKKNCCIKPTCLITLFADRRDVKKFCWTVNVLTIEHDNCSIEQTNC